MSPASFACLSLQERDHWREFLEWLRSNAPAEGPDALLNTYRASLRKRGASVLETEGRLSFITDRMGEQSEGWRCMFNRVYASAEYSAMLPNAFMTRIADELTPGRALDVCTGEGRNAVYLASRGWQVTGFDVAECGLALASTKARHAGVALGVIQSTEQAFPYGQNAWDLIVITYAPVMVTESTFVSKIRTALRPGGVVLIESFALDSRTGRTRIGALEIDPCELLPAFHDFPVRAWEMAEAVPDWGMHASSIVRLLVRAR